MKYCVAVIENLLHSLRSEAASHNETVAWKSRSLDELLGVSFPACSLSIGIGTGNTETYIHIIL